MRNSEAAGRVAQLSLVLALVLGLSALPLLAVRPFVTDDARVVGNRQAQLETWVRGDRHAFEHWVLGSYGPTSSLELTAGGLQGVDLAHGRTYSISGPLLQAKYLVWKPKPGARPGLALSGGGIAPGGSGPFKLQGWDQFGFAAVTHSFHEGDDVLIHANLGAVRSSIGGKKATWGTGSQLRVRGGLHAVGEVFSGDPYADSSGVAFQAGFRHFISDYVQVDATVGKSVSGRPGLPVWGTVGLRLATPPLTKRVFKRSRNRDVRAESLRF